MPHQFKSGIGHHPHLNMSNDLCGVLLSKHLSEVVFQIYRTSLCCAQNIVQSFKFLSQSIGTRQPASTRAPTTNSIYSPTPWKAQRGGRLRDDRGGGRHASRVKRHALHTSSHVVHHEVTCWRNPDILTQPAGTKFKRETKCFSCAL